MPLLTMPCRCMQAYAMFAGDAPAITREHLRHAADEAGETISDETLQVGAQQGNHTRR